MFDLKLDGPVGVQLLFFFKRFLDLNFMDFQWVQKSELVGTASVVSPRVCPVESKQETSKCFKQRKVSSWHEIVASKQVSLFSF